jgi:hypothetical protein
MWLHFFSREEDLMISIHQRILFCTLALALVFSAPTLAVTTVYDNLGDYLNATAPGFYLEDFSAFAFGAQPNPLPFGPVNGFSYDMDALGGLFSGGGNMSTNTAFDSLVIDFTGDTVTSVGGNFWLSDFDVLPEIGTLTIELADGSATTENVVDALPDTFR